MTFYENVFIARQDIASTQVDALADQFTQIITDNGGQVLKREYWGLRNISYRIRKNRKAHYVLLNIDAPPAAVKEMERTMGINEDILRYLTIRVDALEEGPSAMMQAKTRDDRDRGDRSDRGDRDRGDRGDRGDRPRRDRYEREEPREARVVEAPDAPGGEA